MEEIKKERTPCKVFSRVNGWLTSIDTWNPGKSAEWVDRNPYSVSEINIK